MDLLAHNNKSTGTIVNMQGTSVIMVDVERPQLRMKPWLIVYMHTSESQLSTKKPVTPQVR